MRYDPDSPLVLATDSSSYGLGAVLSHRTAEGVERPIAYASRSEGTWRVATSPWSPTISL